jgi:class 3 adenylate cyclase
LDSGYPRPWARIVLVAATTLATTVVISRFVGGIERLSRSERVLHEQVASARLELESRVREQVDEIDRLGRLRRFLSPQVADAVMSAGGDALLATHRRQIAVIFVDLRGFTGFSAVAEPEDVVEVLTEFYDAVGVIVKRLGATVGGFAGDGVMAYFNDPFPCEDPAGRALEMATSLREPMARLGGRWRQRGFVIGYGAGIAYGYATLGTIGFEERTDYTPIGSVVNLASRLCDEAPSGEVLLDGRAHAAVGDRIETEPVHLELKGFNGPVTAFRVALDSAPR